MRKVVGKLQVCFFVGLIVIGAILVSAQNKTADKQNAKQNQAAGETKAKSKPKVSVGPPQTIHMKDCVADRTSIHASGPVHFVADDRDYYIFLDKDEIFNERERYKLVLMGQTWTFNANQHYSGSITSQWWILSFSACPSRSGAHTLSPGDPNDITVP